MRKSTKVLLLIIALLTFGIVSAQLAVHNYKNNCEIIGNSQGQKWLECNL